MLWGYALSTWVMCIYLGIGLWITHRKYKYIMSLFSLYELFELFPWLGDFPEDQLEILETVKEEYDMYGDAYWFWFYLFNSIIWLPQLFLNEIDDE